MARLGAELLDLIGPAVVSTSSAGGLTGRLLPDRRLEQVRAIAALEPLRSTGPVPSAGASPMLSVDRGFPPATAPVDFALEVTDEDGNCTRRHS